MQNWFHIVPKTTGLSLYAWLIFCLLPFYFVIRLSTFTEIIAGVLMIVLFFAVYRISFIKEGWTVYVAVGIELVISTGMTLYFGYVYFFLFLAFFIGNIRNKAGFVTLYIINLITALSSAGLGFYMQSEIFTMQLPFVVISLVGVILLPFTIYNRNKQEMLENQLENANEKISQLMVMEERQRIARDLHDTLGQKLSLIGLKSDLAEKLVEAKPGEAQNEMKDINRTARLALKEVREMVSDMRGMKVREELLHIQEILKVAQIELYVHGNPQFTNVPLLVENALSMCMKEAVTNVVKHSQAARCDITITQSPRAISIVIEDNGIGISQPNVTMQESGIQGMKERLEFVNGTLTMDSQKGTKITMFVPQVVQHMKKEEEA
ncbi:sensor histidine kinase [Alkalicoccus daliensis]|uniref:histidine kinase n=1 Tax=Alkalicoccus daliensis TaxID=745820 RepID=A0A1H0JL47_9BACI|nr:sensor histidine kinase [Alkalicoccus daliensis]SDO44292.1 two-component system, NarL family, sensor histidine kinase DesK [Alkalicoccus daliensis]